MDRDHRGSMATAAEPLERIAYLERQLDRLRQQQRHQERLEDLNRLLLKNALQELDASRQRAEAANRAKTDFLANMSHEIRTPLNILLGMGELLEATALDDQQRQYVGRAQGAGQHLLELINNILEFSKIERGELQIIEEPFDLHGLVGNLASIFAAICADKGLDFFVHCPAHLRTWHLGDQAKIRQVLLNLLANGVKFTDTGQLRLSVEGAPAGSPATLLFTIEDTGIGIDARDQKRIFERFSQVEPALRKARQGGVGLGLSIVQLLVEKMGGTIEVDSVVGRGSTFTVALPLAAAEGDGCRPQLPPRAPGEDDAALAGQSLLVVDDVPGNLFVVEHYLDGIGMRISSAAGGRQAVDNYRRSRFDTVLLDICMPEVDGIEALRRIRAIERGDGRPPAYIAAMTAHAFQEITEELQGRGFDAILTKPFSRHELLATLRRQNGAPGGGGARTRRAKRARRHRQDIDIPPPLLPLVPVLLEKLRSEQQDVRERLQRGELEALAKTCHANKGVAGMYGFFKLSRCYQALENSVKQDDSDSERICAELESYLTELDHRHGQKTAPSP